MADDRLPPCFSLLIASASSDNVIFRPSAISRNAFQNVSSRLTLVAWPATTTERLTTEDVIACSRLGIRRCRGGHQQYWKTKSARRRPGRARWGRDAHCRAVVG